MKKTTVTPRWELSRRTAGESRHRQHVQDAVKSPETPGLVLKAGKDSLMRGIVHFAVLIALLLVLSACGNKDNKKEKYTVFYLTPEINALVTRDVELPETPETASKSPASGGTASKSPDTDAPHNDNVEQTWETAEALLDLLKEDHTEEGFRAPVKGFSCRDFSISKHTITLDFTSEYKKLDMITEKLTRAAVVNTLCGVKGIRRVTIRVNGALLVDDRGNKSENMTADQFIYNSGREMINFERSEIHLYFASKDGKKLVETYREVVFNSNIPMERLVVEEIIRGPNGDFNYTTVNPETKIINIVTRDDICTVTLDSSFLLEPFPNSPEVAVYSIVNSLTELPTIRQVQIIVDGAEGQAPGSFSLDSDKLFHKNTDIVLTK